MLRRPSAHVDENIIIATIVGMIAIMILPQLREQQSMLLRSRVIRLLLTAIGW
jgi:hypothetical protein